MTHPYGQGDFSSATHPAYYGQAAPPPPQPPPSRLPQILAGVAVIVAVGAVAAVVALLLTSTSSDDDGAPSPSTMTAAPPTSATVVDQQPQATVTVTPQTTITTTARPGTGPVAITGADSRGFRSGPRCNAPEDPLVFIGYTNRSRVVVCQVGDQVGRNYYQGYADGNTIEVGYPVRSGSTFTATSGTVAYSVSPSALVITENGRTIATEPMIQAWVD